MSLNRCLDISKTTTATDIEAGDTVTYTITVQHTATSTASAYDLEIIDTLPVQLQNARVVSALIDAHRPVDRTFGFSGNTLTVVRTTRSTSCWVRPLR